MSSSGLAWRKKSCHTLQVEHDQDELPEAVLKLRGTTLPLHNRPSGRALAYWLAAILTLWWLSPKRIESQLSPSSSSSSATTTLPRGGDRIVWGLQDETIQRIDLPAPQDDKYISTLQAAVVSQEETYRHRRGVPADYFLQVLSIIGESRPPQRLDMWQVFVREATYLKDVECVWTIPNGTSLWVRGSMRIPWMWDINEPASGAALMLQCPVDKQWEEMMSLGPHQAKDPHFHHITVAIHLNIEGSASGLDLPLIRLRDYQPPPKTAVGMCTAPIYGDYKPDEWIDWREHHKLLGFEPVHWYSRDFVLGDFLQDYSTFNSSGDTYRHAPPVNPEVYDTELLSNSGLYSDQVVLAMDCMLRSKYVGPSEWLAFFDMDEYFLPDPMPTTREKRATSAADFLAKFGSHVPSVSLGRTHKADNARLDLAARNNEELRMFPRMSALALIRDPHKEDPPGNHKHMHRVSAVEATSVHAPTELYPGHIYTPPIVPAPVRLVHLGSSIYNTGPYRYFNATSAVDDFRSELHRTKQQAYMEWKATTELNA